MRVPEITITSKVAHVSVDINGAVALLTTKQARSMAIGLLMACEDADERGDELVESAICDGESREG